LAQPETLVQLQTLDYFSDGVYARELFIPKGTVLTGKIHKRTNLNIMVSGELIVSTEAGMQRVKAPFIVVSPPGTKRVAYALEDTRWITIHGTHETDVEVIEQLFTAESEAEYLEYVGQNSAQLELEGV
jgi:hypothetical protein